MPDDQVVESTEGEETPAETGVDSSAQIAELTEMVKGLSTKLEEQKRANDNLLFDPEVLNRLNDDSQKGDSDSEQAGDVAFDPDTASNAEIVNFLMTQVESSTSNSTKALEGKIDKLVNAMNMKAAQDDLRVTTIKHPDLAEKLDTSAYKDKFYTVAKDNPSWQAEKVYKQVEMELEHEQRLLAKAAEAKANAEFSSFSEKGGAPSSVVVERDMDKDEAADAAWREVMGTKKEMLD